MLTQIRNPVNSVKAYHDIYAPITQAALNQIPASMKTAARWVVWGGNKCPVNGNSIVNGFLPGADITDSRTWMPFEKAASLIGAECYVKRENSFFHVTGIGFVVGDGYFCIDADGGEAHGREPVPPAVISDLCRRTGTYAEMSISGNGCHVFGQCDFVTEDGKEHFSQSKSSYEIEFFTRRKFIAITGNRIPDSSTDLADCSEAARQIYADYVLSGCRKREEEEKKRREEYRKTISIDPNDSNQFFLLNYPEILMYSDSSNFRRGGTGGRLGSGEYSWIGAIKSMQEIGVPEDAIMDWCRRGSNFQDEKDVLRVLREQKQNRSGKNCLGSIIQDAQNHGWKPAPEKLTGEYKKAHDDAAQRKKDFEQFEEKMREHFNRNTSDTGTITQLTCGAAAPDQNQPVPGVLVHTVAPAAVTAPAAINPPDVLEHFKPLSAEGDKPLPEKRYLYKPYFPLGKFSIITADPGTGKTKIVDAIAALVTNGRPWMDIPCGKPGPVLIFSMEDDREDHLATIVNCGGDISKVILPGSNDEDLDYFAKNRLTFASPEIETLIAHYRPSLVIFDPYQKYVGSRTDTDKANKLSEALVPLTLLSRKYDCHILVVAHNIKAQTSKLQYKFMGSVDFIGEARSGMMIVRDPDRLQEQENILIHIKSNNTRGRSIRCRIDSVPGNEDYATVKWLGLEDYSERDYMLSNRSALQSKARSLNETTDEDPTIKLILDIVKENPGRDEIRIGISDFGICYMQINGSLLRENVSREIKRISEYMEQNHGLLVECVDARRLMGFMFQGKEYHPAASSSRCVRIIQENNTRIAGEQQSM